MEKKKNYTVTIREDYVVRDPEKARAILERVAKIVSNSYVEGKRGTGK